MRIHLRKACFSILVLGIILAALPVAAQQIDPTLPGGAMSVEPVMTELPDSAQIRAVESPLWRQYGLDKAGLPSRLLQVLSEQNLKELAAGEDTSTIRTMSGLSINEVMDLGSAFDEMVYTPVTPCRVIDTLTAGGAFAGGEQRNYNLIGPANYAVYGGNPAGCGIPPDFGGGLISFNRVQALNLNFISVLPGGPGDFRAWPSNQAVPVASVLNYAAVGGGLNIANGVAVTTCNAICLDLLPPFTCGDPCPTDLSIRADVSGTQLIVDVYGYYTGATTSALQGNSAKGVFVGAPFLDISDGACHNVTSVTISNNSSVGRGVVCFGSTNAEIAHTNGTTDEYQVNLTTVNGTTCSAGQPGEGEASFEIPGSFPTASAIDHALNVTERFSLNANTSATYFLNARMALGGTTATDAVINGAIVCMSDP